MRRIALDFNMVKYGGAAEEFPSVKKLFIGGGAIFPQLVQAVEKA